MNTVFVIRDRVTGSKVRVTVESVTPADPEYDRELTPGPRPTMTIFGDVLEDVVSEGLEFWRTCPEVEVTRMDND